VSMDELDYSEERKRSLPSVCFAGSFKNRCIALAGVAFFLLGAYVIYTQLKHNKPAILAILMALVFLGDFLDLVIIGSKKIYRVHFFWVSSVISRELITICSTSKGKYGEEIYLYGYGAHMTMLRSQRLWKKLMDVIGIPEDVREKLEKCEGDLYVEQLRPDLHVRSQRAQIDYLFHSEDFVSTEIRRTLPESFYEEMAERETAEPLTHNEEEEAEETEKAEAE